MTDNEERAIQRTQELLNGGLDDTKLSFLRMWLDNLMVVSCAGSGKTKFCKSLIVSRILSGEVKPNEVLYMSFSKDCIKDTKTQVASLLEKADVKGDCVIKTVHSVFYALLSKLGVIKNARQILSVTDERHLMNRAQKLLGFYELSADDLLKLYECECEGLEEPNHLMRRILRDKATGDKVIQVLDTYKEQKAERLGLSELGLLLLYLCTDTVEEQAAYIGRGLGYIDKYSGAGLSEEKRAGYLAAIKATLHKYKLVVIDEVQDLNVAQHKFLELVFGIDAGMPPENKLVFVGDDDQCIYEWRYSNVDLMRQAPLRYGLQTVYMTKSYRCCDEIMALGEHILKSCADQGRWEKPLEGRGEHGVVKEIGAKCRTMKARADAFARILCAYEFSEEIGKETAAILMRYRSSAVPIFLYLYDLENNASGMTPNQFNSVYALDGNFDAEKSVKDLRMICDIVLNEDVGRYDKLLTLMGAYISTETRKRLLSTMQSMDVSIIELPFLLRGDAAPAPYGKPRSEDEIKAVSASLKFATTDLYPKTMEGLVKLAVLAENLEAHGKKLNDFYLARYFIGLCVPDDARTFVIPALASAHERGQVTYDWAVDHLKFLENEPVTKDGKKGLRYISTVLNSVEDRYLSSGSPTVRAPRLTIRTVHSAKGLQWDTVFFIDGDTEGKSSTGNEEVRICYVGVTRARNRLIV